MTPQEWAAVILMRWRKKGTGYTGQLQENIAAAIEQAVAEEREACAGIAEQEATKHGISPDASFGSEGYGWNRASAAIVAAIRARAGKGEAANG